MSSEVLKALPCPFCGGPSEMWLKLPTPAVWCKDTVNCGAMLELPHRSKAEAIAAWNARQPQDAGAVERERIIAWLLEVGDDWPWTGLDIANFIRAGCEPWPEALRRDAGELATMRAQLSDAIIADAEQSGDVS